MGPGASGPWHCPLFVIICHGGLTDTKLRMPRHCQAPSRVSEGIGRGARGQDALTAPLQGASSALGSIWVLFRAIRITPWGAGCQHRTHLIGEKVTSLGSSAGRAGH